MVSYYPLRPRRKVSLKSIYIAFKQALEAISKSEHMARLHDPPDFSKTIALTDMALSFYGVVQEKGYGRNFPRYSYKAVAFIPVCGPKYHREGGPRPMSSHFGLSADFGGVDCSGANVPLLPDEMSHPDYEPVFLAAVALYPI